MTYRFLATEDFPEMRVAFNRAFADYFVESQLSEEQLAHHLAGSAVRLELSVGAFADREDGEDGEDGEKGGGGEMVGLLLNGVDTWGGQLTAYDAGTGVVPAHRGRGMARAMFRFAVPKLREAGVRRCLLEVIKENEPAIRAYRELGFAPTRGLQCLKRPADSVLGSGAAGDAPPARVSEGPSLRIEEVREPVWDLWSSFWDWQPSWQNSPGSIARLSGRWTSLGAFHEGHCIGYVVFVPSTGRIMQIAVAADWRRQAVGTRLLRSVRAQVATDRDLSIINVDASAQETLAFLQAGGFVPTIGQHEMALAL